MTLKLSNNATSLLSAGINTSALSLAITSGDEDNFPVLGVGDWCPITVVDALGNRENMRCTARSGVTLTVIRAQEGTTAQSFSAGARVDVRLTVGAMQAWPASWLADEVPDTNLPERLKETPAVVADANALDASGMYLTDGSTANTPVAVAGYITHIQIDADTIFQNFESASAAMSFARRRVSGTWGDWYERHYPAAAVNIASVAGTTNLAALNARVGNLTGNLAITGFGTMAAGVRRTLLVTGTPTFTHNATSLILPGAANIVGAAGDVIELLSLGSGNWKCVGYQRASGYPVNTSFDSAIFSNFLSINSTNSGAGAGPTLYLSRQSPSPQVSDWLGNVSFDGFDLALNLNTYAYLLGYIANPTNGAEAGGLLFGTQYAGAAQTRLRIERGLMVGNPTGGDKGVGAINLETGCFVNGSRLGGAPDVVLENRKSAGTGGGALTTSMAQVPMLEISDPNGLMTVSGNRFTPSVNMKIEWSCPIYSTGGVTQIYNVTTGSVVRQGTNAKADSGPNTQGTSFGGCDLVAANQYEMQAQGTSNQANGLGIALNLGSDEGYARIVCWRTT